MEDKTVELLADKVDTAITTLSSKLGVAADHFYPILVKQQIISGWISLSWSILWLSCALILSFIAINGIKNEADGDAVGWFVFIAILMAVAAVIMFSGGLLSVLNPEYYALLEVTRLIK